MYWRRDKGGVGRGWGPVPEPAYHALLAAVQRGDPQAPLWGRRWTNADFYYRFRQIADAAGVREVQPYDLRRFAATRIVAAVGGNLPAARAYTGHTQDQTLLRYVYAPAALAEEAAATVRWSAAPLEALEGGHTPGT